jgi:hypothetical protein
MYVVMEQMILRKTMMTSDTVSFETQIAVPSLGQYEPSEERTVSTYFRQKNSQIYKKIAILRVLLSMHVAPA